MFQVLLVGHIYTMLNLYTIHTSNQNLFSMIGEPAQDHLPLGVIKKRGRERERGKCEVQGERGHAEAGQVTLCCPQAR